MPDQSQGYFTVLEPINSFPLKEKGANISGLLIVISGQQEIFQRYRKIYFN